MITPVRPHSHLPKENIIPIAAFSILLFSASVEDKNILMQNAT